MQLIALSLKRYINIVKILLLSRFGKMLLKHLLKASRLVVYQDVAKANEKLVAVITGNLLIIKYLI